MRLTLLILSSFLAISCVPQPPDVPVCQELSQREVIDPVTKHLTLTPSPTCEKEIGEAECGHCVLIVSGKESYFGNGPGHGLNGKTWAELKAESVYVPAVESYGPLSDYIVNSCEKMKCNKQVDVFKVKIESLKDLTGH